MVEKYFLLLSANAVTFFFIFCDKTNSSDNLKKRRFIFGSWTKVMSVRESRWQKWWTAGHTVSSVRNERGFLLLNFNFFVFIRESQYMEKHNLETSCIFPLLLTQSRNIWTTWPGSCLLGDYRLGQVDSINPHKWIV